MLYNISQRSQIVQQETLNHNVKKMGVDLRRQNVRVKTPDTNVQGAQHSRSSALIRHYVWALSAELQRAQ